MLGLGDEVERRRATASAGGVGQHQSLRGTGWQVDADVAGHLDLRRRHPRVARSDDPVDGLEDSAARVSVGSQAVGQCADRLCTTGDDERIDTEQAGRAEEHRMRRPHPRSAGEATTTRSTPASGPGRRS